MVLLQQSAIVACVIVVPIGDSSSSAQMADHNDDDDDQRAEENGQSQQQEEEEEEGEKKPVIGIDLGTTYSCVAVFQYGMVEIIPNDLGHRTTPSIVTFTENEKLIGEAAKIQAVANDTNAFNTVYDAKRLVGRGFNEPTVKEDMKHFTFKVANQRGKPEIEVFRGCCDDLLDCAQL